MPPPAPSTASRCAAEKRRRRAGFGSKGAWSASRANSASSCSLPFARPRAERRKRLLDPAAHDGGEQAIPALVRVAGVRRATVAIVAEQVTEPDCGSRLLTGVHDVVAVAHARRREAVAGSVADRLQAVDAIALTWGAKGRWGRRA